MDGIAASDTNDCPGGHGLTRFHTDGREISCNACAEQARGEFVQGCRQCNHFVCSTCWAAGIPEITFKVGSTVYESTGANFGPTAVSVIGADLVPVASDACTKIDEDLTGKVALINRGGCPFDIKAKMAEEKGAVAVVFVNNTATPLFPLSRTDTEMAATITIHVRMVSQADGAAIRALNTAKQVATIESDTETVHENDNMFILDLTGHTPGEDTAKCMRRAVGSVLKRAIDDEKREKELAREANLEQAAKYREATVAEIVAMGYGLGVAEVAVELANIYPNDLSWPSMPVTGKVGSSVGGGMPGPLCLNRHTMVHSDYSRSGYGSGYYCDRCRGQSSQGHCGGSHMRWFCRECEADICFDCVPADCFDNVPVYITTAPPSIPSSMSPGTWRMKRLWHLQ